MNLSNLQGYICNNSQVMSDEAFPLSYMLILFTYLNSNPVPFSPFRACLFDSVRRARSSCFSAVGSRRFQAANFLHFKALYYHRGRNGRKIAISASLSTPTCPSTTTQITMVASRSIP